MRSFFLLALALVSLIFTSCDKNATVGDVTFAKNTFESLARGDSTVTSDIDWETFNSSGVSVGMQYAALPNDSEKESFRKSFVNQFAASFRDSGGKLENFTNWRVTSNDEINTIVTADSPTGVLNLTVSERNGTEKLSAMQVVK